MNNDDDEESWDDEHSFVDQKTNKNNDDLMCCEKNNVSNENDDVEDVWDVNIEDSAKIGAKNTMKMRKAGAMISLVRKISQQKK